jgi:hypothetical protein
MLVGISEKNLVVTRKFPLQLHNYLYCVVDLV